MPVDGGVTIVGAAVAAGGAALLGTGAALIYHHFKIKLNELEELDRAHAKNVERSRNLLTGGSGRTHQLTYNSSVVETSYPVRNFLDAVWEFNGKEWVLRLGAVIILTFSATQLQALELKPATSLIYQTIGECFPDSGVSYNNCKEAATALGEIGGLKNIVEDTRKN